MPKGILVFAEQRDGKLKKGAFEALTAAKTLSSSLNCEVNAVVVGENALTIGAELGNYGAAKVLAAESPLFKFYSTEGYGKAVLKAVEALDPQYVFFCATAMGKDLGPYLSASLDAPLASDLIDLQFDGGTLKATRPVYAGKARLNLQLPSGRCLISLRPNVFVPKTCGGNAAVGALDHGVSDADIRAKVVEVQQAAGGKADLTEAEIIVSGGRGLKETGNFKLVEDLADALGATVGASRAVVDAGWRPHSEQVGQTGKTVTPTLYFACGISGAVQHLAGMSSSKCIVAINKDPDAPIFNVADYGIVGDALEILPALTAEIRKRKNS